VELSGCQDGFRLHNGKNCSMISNKRALTGYSFGQYFAVQERPRYEAGFPDLFDTVTVIKGYSDSQEEFTERAQELYAELEHLSELLDICSDYQRYYILDGVRYHHIIDPETLMPAGSIRKVRSV